MILHVASASASPYVSAKAASPTRGDPNVHAPTISALATVARTVAVIEAVLLELVRREGGQGAAEAVSGDGDGQGPSVGGGGAFARRRGPTRRRCRRGPPRTRRGIPRARAGSRAWGRRPPPTPRARRRGWRASSRASWVRCRGRRRSRARGRDPTDVPAHVLGLGGEHGDVGDAGAVAVEALPRGEARVAVRRAGGPGPCASSRARSTTTRRRSRGQAVSRAIPAGPPTTRDAG